MAVDNTVSLQLPGAVEILNPTPSDPRKRVDSLSAISNSPVYFVGFDNIYVADEDKHYNVKGGDAENGWLFEEFSGGSVGNGLSSDNGKIVLGGELEEDTLVKSDSVFGLKLGNRNVNEKLSYFNVNASNSTEEYFDSVAESQVILDDATFDRIEYDSISAPTNFLDIDISADFTVTQLDTLPKWILDIGIFDAPNDNDWRVQIWTKNAEFRFRIQKNVLAQLPVYITVPNVAGVGRHSFTVSNGVITFDGVVVGDFSSLDQPISVLTPTVIGASKGQFYSDHIIHSWSLQGEEFTLEEGSGDKVYGSLGTEGEIVTSAGGIDHINDVMWDSTFVNLMKIEKTPESYSISGKSVNMNGVNLKFETTAKTPTSTGEIGQKSYNGGFMYTCVATDTWVRQAVDTSWQ